MKKVKMLKTALGRDDGSFGVTEFLEGKIYHIGDDLYRGFSEQGVVILIDSDKIECEEKKELENKIVTTETKEKPRKGKK